MPALPSYEALAKSIERALRTDLAPPGSASHLAGSIDELLLAEARAGELRLAELRVVVIVPLVILSGLALIRGDAATPLTSQIVAVLASVVWLGSAVALVLALRRGWYRRWVSHAVPWIDAGIILVMMLASAKLEAAGWTIPPATLAYGVALCAFLGLSGGLRLSRSAAETGTVLSVAVVLAIAAIARVPTLLAIAIAVTLLATGLLSNSVLVLVRRVVTDEVARTTLKEMVQEANEAIDAREQVLKIVSHDLRNPLNTISMSASLLLEIPATQEQLTDHMHRIKRAGARMNKLIEDLLDAAKIEGGRLAIDAKPIDVVPVLREAHEMLAPLASEKGIRLDVNASEGLPTVTADGGRVLQVLSNLVGNAIKFTPKGGRIVMRADPARDGVKFSVSDTGPGIPPEQLGKVFGRFWMQNPSDRRGIGLGLTIAKGIVEAHGGRIWVESPPGQGTTFHFKLDTVLSTTSSGGRERRQSGSG